LVRRLEMSEKVVPSERQASGAFHVDSIGCLAGCLGVKTRRVSNMGNIPGSGTGLKAARGVRPTVYAIFEGGNRQARTYAGW
jgi:hypothetical protein